MSEKTFNAKLRAALAEMPNPAKDNKAVVPTKSGKTYTYNYEDLASLTALIKPILSEHELGFYQESYYCPDRQSYILRTHVFDDSEDRIKDERPLQFGSDAQAAGSYETYMRRYALKTVFGIAGDDDDGEATTHSEKPQTARNQQKSTDTPKPEQKPVEEHSEAYTKTRHEALKDAAELKKKALALGIHEEGIMSWVNVYLQGRKFNEATLEEAIGIGNYIQKLINDKESLNGDQLFNA